MSLTITIPTLVTRRLVLRPHRMQDFEAFAAFLASPRSGFVIETPSRRNAWSAFASDVAGWVLRGFGQWAVELKDGTTIGQTGVGQPDAFPEPEIGWILYDGHEGKGYATEAARAAMDWARDRVPSLVSYITPGNERSIALAERLGAVRDHAAPLPLGEDHTETAVYRHWGPA